MQVGHDHVASTVCTVTFAYAGAAMPSLLLVKLYDQPVGNSSAPPPSPTELLRSAVGGIALAITVPLTTALAAALILHFGAS